MIERCPDPERKEQRYLGLTGGQLNGGFLAIVGVVVAGVCAWLFLFDGIHTVTGKKESDQSVFMAQQAANGAILKLSDLPEGWKARLPGDANDDFEFEFTNAVGRSHGIRLLARSQPQSLTTCTRRTASQ